MKERTSTVMAIATGMLVPIILIYLMDIIWNRTWDWAYHNGFSFLWGYAFGFVQGIMMITIAFALGIFWNSTTKDSMLPYFCGVGTFLVTTIVSILM